MKSIQLVRRAAELGTRLKDLSALSDAGKREVGLKMVRVTTSFARRLKGAPLPTPGAPERLLLTVAASQLRALASALPSGASAGELPQAPDNGIKVKGEERALAVGPPEGSMHDALSELVEETLSLVDKLLRAPPEVTHDRRDDKERLGNG